MTTKFLIFLLILFTVKGKISAISLNMTFPVYDAYDEVFFNLFTRENPTTPQKWDKDNFNMVHSHFKNGNPVKIYVHGTNDTWMYPKLVEAFLDEGDVNVVLVDWTAISNDSDYLNVLQKVPGVGKYLAGFIDHVYSLGVMFNDVHLIGTDVGSHVVGWAGRICKNGKVAYITACDPSNMLRYTSYGNQVPEENYPSKVNSQDAQYVEVIHTNTDYYGLLNPIGTADFYPNEGRNMPGCNSNLCSHKRAIEYFVDSINGNEFTAVQCNNYYEIYHKKCASFKTTHMGGTTPKNIHGVFFLKTNAERPYQISEFMYS